MTNREASREDVIQLLLDQSRSSKLTRGAQARSCAEHLYRRASGTYPTWKKIAAYRLAQVRLRSEHTPDQLREIDRLFCEAGRLAAWPDLAAMAKVYRLAVLHRLRALAETPSAESVLDVEISLAHQEAANFIADTQRRPLAMRRNTANRTSQDPLAIIQTEVFNLLELATFFLGEPYAALEGIGTRDLPVPNDSMGWSVAGYAVGYVRMIRELAISEVQDRVYAVPHAVWFEFSPEHTNLSAEYRLFHGRDSVAASHAELALLTCFLANQELSAERLRQLVTQFRHPEGEVGEDDAGYVRQQKRRLKKKLAQLLDRPENTIWTDQAREVPQFAEDLLVLGAVENLHRFL